MTLITCAQCGVETDKPTGGVNRAIKAGRPLYCGRSCAGLARRSPVERTIEQRKADKSAYDKRRRAQRGDEIRAYKRRFYFDNRERLMAEHAAYRATHKEQHNEYCRRPEYRALKRQYDRQHRAKQQFGPFAEVALVLQDLEVAIDARATWHERHATTGTINKAQQRRRAL